MWLKNNKQAADTKNEMSINLKQLNIEPKGLFRCLITILDEEGAQIDELETLSEPLYLNEPQFNYHVENSDSEEGYELTGTPGNFVVTKLHT